MKKIQHRRKRVLISGGAGFIGSFLCENYLNQDWEVICLDNLFTGNKENISHLLDDNRFEFVRHDIVNDYYAEVDLILNFACPASPIHYQYNPIKTIKTAIMGTMNLLGLAKRVNARFVQASTSEVYGDPKVHPQPESYWGNVNPIGIRSCYDEGKRVGETLCFDYHREHGVDIRVIRIFNTYGPRMAVDDGRVVSNFIAQAIENKSITIYGNGEQTRSFCFVEDLVEGIVKFADQDQHTGPMNLGNTGEFTIKQLAEEVIKQTGSQSQIIFEDLPSDDPKIRKPDTALAKKYINWDPKNSLEIGLEKTIPYFKKKLGA